jgi:hypothetical protein
MKMRAAKKRKIAKLKESGAFIPEERWKRLGKEDKRSFSSFKQAAHDNNEELEVVRETYNDRYLDRPGPSTESSSERSEHVRIAALCEDQEDGEN